MSLLNQYVDLQQLNNRRKHFPWIFFRAFSLILPSATPPCYWAHLFVVQREADRNKIIISLSTKRPQLRRKKSQTFHWLKPTFTLQPKIYEVNRLKYHDMIPYSYFSKKIEHKWIWENINNTYADNWKCHVKAWYQPLHMTCITYLQELFAQLWRHLFQLCWFFHNFFEVFHWSKSESNIWSIM